MGGKGYWDITYCFCLRILSPFSILVDVFCGYFARIYVNFMSTEWIPVFCPFLLEFNRFGFRAGKIQAVTPGLEWNGNEWNHHKRSRFWISVLFIVWFQNLTFVACIQSIASSLARFPWWGKDPFDVLADRAEKPFRFFVNLSRVNDHYRDFRFLSTQRH